MEYKDYYKILGVEEKDDQALIKKVYRRLARKYHPDVSEEANADEKFKEIQEAYQVLKDPEKRAEYDQMRRGNFGGGEFTPPPSWQQGQRTYSDHDFQDQGQFSDFFNNMFNQRYQGAETEPSRGQDQHSKLSVSLHEAYDGGTRQLQLQQPVVDDKTGVVTQKTRTINVKIPKGVKDGQSIRLKGLGVSGLRGGKPGDLYLDVQIAKDKHYQLDGRNITLDVPITPWEAALGAKINVPTLGGKVALNIPAGTQSGTKLRLKGRGLPGTPPGDQFVIVNIHTPVPTEDAHRALYQKMADDMAFNPRQELG